MSTAIDKACIDTNVLVNWRLYRYVWRGRRRIRTPAKAQSSEALLNKAGVIPCSLIVSELSLLEAEWVIRRKLRKIWPELEQAHQLRMEDFDAGSFLQLLKPLHVEIVQPRINVKIASTLIKHFAIDAYDALLVSCAIAEGCKYFVTTDGDLLEIQKAGSMLPNQIKPIDPAHLLAEYHIPKFPKIHARSRGPRD